MATLSELAKRKKETEPRKGGLSKSSSRYSENNLTKVGETISSYLNDYQNNLQSYVSYYNDRAGKRQPGVYVSDAEDYADLTTRQKAWYDTTSQRINKLLDDYGSYLSKDYVDSVKNFLSSNGKLVDQINQTAMSDDQYWSQYTPEQYEKTYDQYIYGQKYKDASYSDFLSAVDSNSTSDRERAWLAEQGYMRQDELDSRINEVKGRIADLEKKYGRYRIGNSTEYREAQAELGRLESMNSQSNMIRNAADYETRYRDKANEWVSNLTPETSLAEGNRILNVSQQLDAKTVQDVTWSDLADRNKNWEYLTKDEINVYHYLLNTQGSQVADQYLKDYQTLLDYRANQQIAQEWRDAPWYVKLAGNIVSVPASVLGGIPAALDNGIRQLAGVDINPYSGAQSLRNLATNVRSATGESLDELGGDGILSFLYQAAMSAVDSTVGALTLGQFSLYNGSNEALKALTNLYTLSMGSSAGATEAQKLYEKGASASEVFWGGLTAGIAEDLFEYVSLDKLLKSGNPATVGQIVKSWLEQSLVEGSEEIATSVANYLTNSIIMGSRSDLTQEIAKRVNGYYDESGIWHEGVSYEEAEREAQRDAVLGILEDGLAGFISGGLSSGAYTTAQGVKNVHTGAEINRAGTASGLVNAGLNTLDTESQTYKTAQRLNKQLENGKSLTGINARMGLGSLLSTGLETSAGEFNQAQERYRQSVSDDAIRAAMEKAGLSADLFDTVKANVMGNVTEEQVNAYNSNETLKSVVDDLFTARRNAADELVGRFANEQSYEGVVKGIEDARKETAEDITERVNEIAKEQNVSNEDIGQIVANYDRQAQKQMTPTIYARAAVEAYNYGITGLDVSEMDNKGHLSSLLSDAQKKLFYGLGVKAQGTTGARQILGKPTGKLIFEKGRGNVHVAEVVKRLSKGSETDKAQAERIKTSIDALRKLSEALGIDIHLYASSKRLSRDGSTKQIWYDEKGREITANGRYIGGTGEIWVDVNSGRNADSHILNTAAHELTHLIKNFSPASFRTLAQFLVDEYKGGNESVDQHVKEQMQIALNNGNKITYEAAFEEFVADSMTDMFSDGQAFEKILRLANKDIKLTRKMETEIGNIARKIRKVYAGLAPDSELGKVFENVKDKFEKLQNMFADAVVTASYAVKGFAVGDVDLVKTAEAVNEEGRQLFEIRAMQTDEPVYRQMLEKWGGMSDEEITKLFTTIDKATELILEHTDILDYKHKADRDMTKDDRPFAPVKPNSDKLYKWSVDFSTLCRKRILQQTIASRLQDRLNRPITREEGIAIRDALKELKKQGKQVEIACALCYVESARMKSPAQIKKFIENRAQVLHDWFADNDPVTKAKMKEYEQAKRKELGVDPKASLDSLPDSVANKLRDEKKRAKAEYVMTPKQEEMVRVAENMTVNDITSPAGLSEMKNKYSDIFYAYTSFVRNATKSKGIEDDTWWRAGDSASIGDETIASMNAENGLRSQSWSDFQVIHLMDYIASVIELSTRGAKQQVYTKVPDFVELMGLTNAMINLSLIPTEAFNGTLEFDDVEGIVYKRALELRDKYHATAGTISIGMNDEQIKMLLASELIDYVIPYHRSSMDKRVRVRIGIPTWEDYERFQQEKKLSREEARRRVEERNKNGRHVTLLAEDDPNYHKEIKFSDWFNLEQAKATAKANKGKSVLAGGYAAMREAANRYLDLCAERGLSPKFSNSNKGTDFTKEENYWKLLIDRKMVDQVTGEVIEQKALTPVFDEEQVMRILNDELARYGTVKADEKYAINKVVDMFTSGKITGKSTAKQIADVMQKPVANVAAMSVTDAVIEYANDAEDIQRYGDYNEKNSVRITDRDTLDYLNQQIENGDYVTVYRSFQIINGGLYAPMNAVDRDEQGKNKKLGYRSELGVWEQATESPEIAQRYMDEHPGAKWAKFDLDGVDNKTGGVAYNPYLHSSNLVLNDQFSAAYRRNLVTVECRVPKSEIGAYHAQYAKDTTGWVEWKPGGVAGKLMKIKPEYTRKLFVSRYMLPYRILSDAEVASMYKEYLDGTDLSVPWNVVTPGLRAELVDAGVPINYEDVKQGGNSLKFEDKFPDEKFMFRGAKAQGFDKVAESNKIMELIKAGKTPEEIRKETGWFTSYDGKWRFEIDDSKAKLDLETFINKIIERKEKDKQKLRDRYNLGLMGESQYWLEVENINRQADRESKRVLLPTILKHPQLYKAYPQLKYFLVNFKDLDGGVQGYYDGDQSITLDSKFLTPAEKENALDVILHEIQHAVQHFEGFARGSNLTEAAAEIEDEDRAKRIEITKKYRDVGDEIEERVEKYLDENNLKEGGNYSLLGYELPEYARAIKDYLLAKTSWARRGKADENAKESLERAKTHAEFDQSIFDEIDKAGEKVSQLYAQLEALKASEEEPFDRYWRTAGEIEARDTAARRSLNANQRKETRPDIDRNNAVVKYQAREKYSYDELISKDDMPLTNITISQTVNRSNVIATAKKEAAKVGKTNPDGSVSVYVKDARADVIIGADGIKHGLTRHNDLPEKAAVMENIGEILKNSIKVNELIPKKEEAHKTYVLIGGAIDGAGNQYVVRSIVNSYTNNLENIDVLYAASTKKEPAVLNAPGASTPPTGSYISIAQLLDFVNRFYPEILSADVLKHFGHDFRPEGNPKGIEKDVLYQQRGKSNREILSEALESATQNEIEAKRLAEYKSKVEQADELQAHLSELQKQIFGKADRNGQTVKELQDEIRKTNNRIDIIDKQLLRLEAMAPIQRILNREKAENAKLLKEQVKLAESRTIAEYEERSRELVAKYGDRLKERYSLAEQKAKIKKDIRELSKLLTADKEKRVKQGMTELAQANLEQAALMLEPSQITNEDIVRAGVDKANEQERKWLDRYAETLKAMEEAHATLKELRESKTTPDMPREQLLDMQRRMANVQSTLRKMEGTISYLNGKLREVFARERQFYNSVPARTAMETLVNAYNSLETAKQAYIYNAYDPSVAEYLKNLSQEEFVEKTFKQMKASELEQIHKAYRMVLHTIKRANTLFKVGRNATVAETMDKVASEIKDAKKTAAYRGELNRQLNKIGWQFLKPIYAFRMLGSETLMGLYQNIRSGEDTWMVNIQKAKEHIQSLRRKYGYYKWKNNTIEAESRFGEKFKLTRQQAMSLYAYSRRGEQAINHITGKGIVLSEETPIKVGKKTIYRSDPHAYSITTEELNRIIDQLTEDERGYVVEAQKYLSEDMAKLGNEVSMLLYGVELFGEKNYFPLRSSGAQMQKEIRDNAPSLAKLKNAGFSQSTIKRANNAVVLSEFDNVWADHVNEMIMYNAFVPALEDFEKVYGRQNTDTKYGSDNVRTAIEGTWGAGANAYISQLLQDINTGRPTDPAAAMSNGLLSLMKKGATFVSASVAIQQGSAVARAMAYVDPKYFVGNPLLLKHNEKWAELKKYAPIAAIKEMGYFDTSMGRSTREWLNSGEYEGLRQKVGAFFKDGQYRDELLSKAPSFVDEVGWIQIWEAVKKETEAQTNLKGEELLKKAAERFTEVVQLTQVYDSVFSRSGLMRSKDFGMKMVTAFGAEPTTQYNMLLDAIVQGKRGNKKFVPKAIGALVYSILLNTLLKSIVMAARDKDRDKTYLERYFGAAVEDIIDNLNPMTMVPYVKDIVSLAQGYDVERLDVSVIKDVIGGLQTAADDSKSAADRITAAVSAIGQITGVPAKNIIRDARALVNTFNDVRTGNFAKNSTKTGMAVAGEEAFASSFVGTLLNGGIKLFHGEQFDSNYSNGEELWKAYSEGDLKHVERVVSRYKDTNTAVTQFVSQLKKHYQEGDVSREDAENLLKEISEKYKPEDKQWSDNDIYWRLDEWDYVGDDYSKYSDLFEAVSSGVNLKATVNEYLDHGVSKQTLTSQITSQYKPLYKSMTRAERAAIKGYLMNAYALLGYTRVEASKKIDAWLTEN